MIQFAHNFSNTLIAIGPSHLQRDWVVFAIGMYPSNEFVGTQLIGCTLFLDSADILCQLNKLGSMAIAYPDTMLDRVPHHEPLEVMNNLTWMGRFASPLLFWIPVRYLAQLQESTLRLYQELEEEQKWCIYFITAKEKNLNRYVTYVGRVRSSFVF